MNYILYDFLQVAGGAERVTLVLARGLPGFSTVVSRVYQESAPLLGGEPVAVTSLADWRTRPLGRIIEAIYSFRRRAGLLADADIVIYSGFYAPMAVNHQERGRRIYYCHTIPRFAFDLFEHYRGRLPPGTRWIFEAAMRRLRREYRSAIAGMDLVVANSENIRQRLKTYLGRDSVVIHPPVDVERFRWLGDGDYYLSLARLSANKRVDLIVEAFRRMPERRLVVVSGGAELNRLKRLATGTHNIRFTGWQSEQSLTQWVGHARAALYVPIDEDFGMSPVEAMAAGKPVIGAAAGGLLETVLDDETGVLIPEPLSPGRVVEAVNRLERLDPLSMRSACEDRARVFSEAVFLEQVHAILDGDR